MLRERLARLVVDAQRDGAVRETATRWSWDVSGDCQSPVVRELHARASPPHRDKRADGWLRMVRSAFPGAVRQGEVERKFKPTRTIRVGPGGEAPPVTVVLTVRCRKCDNCRRRRARMWTARALSEIRLAGGRTWFGSLTLSPTEQSRAVARARQRLARQGIDFDALGHGDQFRERVRALGPLVTLWLKRVRKQSRSPLRFILVAEHHKSGLPHFHCLVHESDPGRPVRYDHLWGQWLHGYSHFKLVAEDGHTATARYVCGYISKCAAVRVRASAHYGEGPRSKTIASVNENASIRGVRGDVPPDLFSEPKRGGPGPDLGSGGDTPTDP